MAKRNKLPKRKKPTSRSKSTEEKGHPRPQRFLIFMVLALVAVQVVLVNSLVSVRVTSPLVTAAATA